MVESISGEGGAVMAGHTNASMNAALKAKNDEFYTLLTDIKRKCGITASISRERLCCATATIPLNPTFLSILS